MDTLRLGLLLLHLVGFAALFGGMFVQLRAAPRAVNSAMVHGALTMLVTGLILVGVLEGLDAGPNSTKIAVKFVITLLVTVLVVANRRKTSVPTGLFFGLMTLVLVNAGIAVLWSPLHTTGQV
jgi:hypothetical protein